MKTEHVEKYLQEDNYQPLYLIGDSLEVLKKIPDASIDCIITSPPYFRQRKYVVDGIGMERNYEAYIGNILKITKELYRVLKPTGSLWLNIGDTYKNKQLLNIPYRIAIRMQDDQKWILRNTVIWDKVKGAMTSSKDSMGNQYEPLFHFVKNRKGYYYDSSAVRRSPRKAQVENGTVKSATGVSGISYKRKIELSTELTPNQKEAAFSELEKTLERIRTGEIHDFRMVIKGGNQRVTNGDSRKLSGRAKELEEKGFYFLFYNPDGSMISDIWQIIPEDSQGRKLHFAPYPENLVKTPLILTCPESGVVLDPFVGTGTTCVVAKNFHRKSIGIDISEEYIDLAKKRSEEEQ